MHIFTMSPKVDEEPSGCTIIDDDYIKGAVPEIGFKVNQTSRLFTRIAFLVFLCLDFISIRDDMKSSKT
ncbi:unnamed protein product [Medioppia subpectinata]|uniref:Uncharacterized protein n=1 Tax=Medioppia subpectinata TaxID=1979941 RepID=A0A7R9KY48_9ACAR|nr:unnamed protein product [Medioppia subpectinata]CAG2112022.1 unnamed protein product [Medioppia subpectinata]